MPGLMPPLSIGDRRDRGESVMVTAVWPHKYPDQPRLPIRGTLPQVDTYSDQKSHSSHTLCMCVPAQPVHLLGLTRSYHH